MRKMGVILTRPKMALNHSFKIQGKEMVLPQKIAIKVKLILKNIQQFKCTGRAGGLGHYLHKEKS
jgi:hypothetical protein